MRFPRPAAFAALLFLATLPVAQCAQSTEPARQEIVIATDAGTHEFQVEIADEERERALGLMFRREMADDAGMLFDFGREEPASFWMRNTYISLDMLFIRADGSIESIAKRTTPLSDKAVMSQGPVRFVLEINAGLSDALGIEPGDQVSGAALGGR